MSDAQTYIGFGYDDDDVLCAVVGGREYRALADLFAAAPYFHDADHVVQLAQALNHFNQEMKYGVIQDIDAYRREFLERYAREEDLEWSEFALRVGDFDLPDLDQLAPPVVTDGQILFFANRFGLGAPYRVTGPADGSAPLTYTPL